MTGPNDPSIEVHLADGGHVIVDFADAGTEADPRCDAILAELIIADGSEQDLERSIVERATAGGLTAEVSTLPHATIVRIDTGLAVDGAIDQGHRREREPVR